MAPPARTALALISKIDAVKKDTQEEADHNLELGVAGDSGVLVEESQYQCDRCNKQFGTRV